MRCGGGFNHRFGLDDAVLIKDNHIAAAGGIAAALERVRAGLGHMAKIEIEVDTLAQLEEALALGADTILLDNMTPDDLRRAVAMAKGRAVLEASGNVTLADCARHRRNRRGLHLARARSPTAPQIWISDWISEFRSRGWMHLPGASVPAS